MRVYLACGTCRAAEGRACVTKSGKITDHHKGRAFRDTDPKATPNPARDRSAEAAARKDGERVEIPSEIEVALEDAARVARQRTFGTVDDTLDPVEICATLARFGAELFDRDDVWSQDQVDELVHPLEAERDELKKTSGEAEADRDRAREDLAEARADLARLEAEREAERDRALEDLAQVRAELARLTGSDRREASRVALGKLLRTGGRSASELHVGAILDAVELARAGVDDDDRIATCATGLDEAPARGHDDGRGVATWVAACDDLRGLLATEHERSRQLEAFLEDTKSQLRRIIESI